MTCYRKRETLVDYPDHVDEAAEASRDSQEERLDLLGRQMRDDSISTQPRRASHPHVHCSPPAVLGEMPWQRPTDTINQKCDTISEYRPQ